jgi:hypothetical protein
MDATERALLAESFGSAIADAVHAGERDVDGVLAKLGWLDLLDAEPSAAVEIVFVAIGAANARATALDDVIAAALGLEPRPDLAVCLPEFGTWDPSSDGGLATGRVVNASEVVVVGAGGIAVAPMATARVTPVRGLDPDAGLHTVAIDAGAAVAVSGSPWATAVAWAQRALAHELLGASRAMLDLARAHALERMQFDRPIARFQAVRHRLAESLIVIEALDASLAAAADTPNAQTAALAKAVAGNTARTVGAHCQQVLAGIGFTTDHAFHRYFKRTIVLDGLFGTGDDLARAIGSELLKRRSVPAVIEL